jgi:uncharacterized repeat protein (TIGR03803 family)
MFMARKELLLPVRTTAIVFLVLSLVTSLPAGTFKLLHTFKNYNTHDGTYPSSELIMDSAGHLYGTTLEGGFFNTFCSFATCGTVFEVQQDSSGVWKENVARAFLGGRDGASPFASPVLDSAGNLYGTTESGGFFTLGDPGVVYKLTRMSSGRWKESVLYSFTGGADGGGPDTALIFDPNGNAYGIAGYGGTYQNGVVFQLSLIGHGKWTETVLHAFAGGADGAYPGGNLVRDGFGNLYGATSYGGNGTCFLGCGVVFELTPNSGGTWTETIIHSFSGSDGIGPNALILDSLGNLYGSTGGGGAYNNGAVFELTPQSDGTWNETVLYSFPGGNDGAGPTISAFDASGNLYGATYGGGISNPTICLAVGSGCGVAFKLAQNLNGTWFETVLHSFTGNDDGGNPQGGLLLDCAGNVYGVTSVGGADLGGVVYEITP